MASCLDFFKTLFKTLRKQAALVPLFSSHGLKSFLLIVGSTVVILLCPHSSQAGELLHALLQAAPRENFGILVTVGFGSWLVHVRFHIILQS